MQAHSNLNLNPNLLEGFTMKRQKGFSLIELLVVVAIMLVIASIAVPAIVSSTQAANEGAASNTLKTVATAQNGFHGLYGNYPALAKSLGGSASATGCPSIPLATGACMIADGTALQLDTGVMSGYKFVYTPPTTGQEWSLSATPTSTFTGRKSYFVATDGTVSYTTNAGGTITTMTAPGTPLGQ